MEKHEDAVGEKGKRVRRHGLVVKQAFLPMMKECGCSKLPWSKCMDKGVAAFKAKPIKGEHLLIPC